MATAASQSLVSASGCAFSSTCRSPNRSERARRRRTRISFSASSSSSSTSSNQEEADCNAEECAPDKEVGKVSVEWLAGEKTKVAGTYPPKKKGWTGYVEKDTAGQTNIYSVEPAVYVAESGISSGTAGTSGDEAGNTVAVVSLIALIAVAAASNILLQVGKNTPTMQAMVYSGPPLGYYINKFKPVSVVKSAVPAELESAPSPGSN